MYKITWVVLFSVFLSLNLQAQTIERAPYLQSTSSNSTIVKWRTDEPTESTVWYGTSVGNLSSEVHSPILTTEHEVHLVNLNANTKYYYSVGDVNSLAGDDSNHYFRTNPNIGTAEPLRAWVLGDCGSNGSRGINVRDAFYEYNDGEELDMILLLGDNAYSDGEDDEYQGAVFDRYEDVLTKTTLWSCPGNHDYESADLENESGPYYDIFTFPTNGQLGGVPSGTEAYYSFDYGNIHFISMDSEASPKEPGDPMLVWLESDLNATNQDWIIVFFHHPPYSKGSHDSDEKADLIAMRENALPIMEAGGVDLVLSGHSHSYERSYLLNGHYGDSETLEPYMILDDGDGKEDGSGAYNKTNTGADSGKGAVYLVAGNASKDDSGDFDHPVMYYGAKTLGSLLLEINGPQLDLKLINDDNEIEDYFTLIKTGLPNGIAPTVTLTNPSDGEAFFLDEAIAMTANATDVDGQITKVEFFVNGIYEETSYAAPYQISWTASQAGSYTISAKATDNDGQTGVSNLATILVNPVNSVITVSNCPTSVTIPCEDIAGTPYSWTAPAFSSDCNGEVEECEVPTIEGANYLGEWNGSFYFESEDEMRWDQAIALAATSTGYLAAVSSQEENDFIQESMDNDRGWIGYTDEVTEGEFVWINGETSSYENWAEDQPSSQSSSEDYTRFSKSDGTWNDKVSYTYTAIVEVPCDNTPSGDPGLSVSQVAGIPSGGLFPEGTTTITYQATDVCGAVASCSFSVTVTDCGPPCSISAIVENVQCSDNGTPTDTSDDTVTFGLTVEGENASAGWEGSGITGAYGQMETYGPYISVVESVTLTLADQEDASCVTSVSFSLPSCEGPDPSICTEVDIPDFEWMGTLNSSGYYFSENSAKWEDARDICEELGGHLIHINSQEENDFMANYFEDYGNFVLIGMSDHLEENNIVWTDGSALIYNQMDPDFNNSSSKNFGIFNSWSSEWALINGNTYKRYVLEVPCPNSIAAMQSNDTNLNSIQRADAKTTVATIENDFHNLQLFPNPVLKKLTLQFNSTKETKSVSVRILKTDGTIILEEMKSIIKGVNNWQLETSDLPKGIYLLELVTSDAVTIRKFLKG